MLTQPKTKIRKILDAAVALQEPQRTLYLESMCEADPGLREAIDDLLEGRGEVKGFLSDEAPAGSLAPVFRPNQLVADRFRIVRLQGRGGMGEVYEALDERLGNRVGLKTLRADGAASQDAIQRFRREIRVAREAAHPNLCKVFDLLEHVPNSGPPVTCLTMEWLEGETLQSLLERRRPLPVDQALALLRQIAAAVDELHRAGIVHRDLKPGNVMLVPDGPNGTRVVITDFGLAKPVAGDAELFETRLDAQAGAPYFMAPEQLGNEKASPASDIYAFGLIADEMVTESRAFTGASVAALYYQRLAEKPKPPSARRQGLPPQWNTAILTCLEREPGQRPKTAGEMVRSLEPGAPKGAWVRGWTKVRKSWVAALVLAAALIPALREPKFQASMVVFRLADLSNDDALGYLPGGLTSELMARLSRVDGLDIKPFYERRDRANLSLVRERFHLDGDLRNHGGQLRVTMRLVDASKDGRLVWSQSFDRDLGNPLDLESEIARGVVEAVEGQMFAEASSIDRARYASLSKTRPLRTWLGLAASGASEPPPAARYSYMRARQLLEEATADSLRGAVPLFTQALAQYPGYGLAHAGLSDVYRQMVNRRMGSQEELMRMSWHHAEEAVRVSPLAPESHASLAGVRQMAWNWEGAEASYKEAIRLDPNSPAAYRRYGGLLIQFGRFDEGFALIKKGLELDPYDYNSHSAFGLCLMLARRYHEAADYLKWTLARHEVGDAHEVLALTYTALGRQASGPDAARYFDAAWEEATAFRRREGEKGTVSPYLYALIQASRGNTVEAHRWLDALRELDPEGKRGPERFARIHGALGQKELAEAHLLHAARLRDRGLLYLKVHWVFDSIRDTAAYRQVMEDMKLR